MRPKCGHSSPNFDKQKPRGVLVSPFWGMAPNLALKGHRLTQKNCGVRWPNQTQKEVWLDPSHPGYHLAWLACLEGVCVALRDYPPAVSAGERDAVSFDHAS